MHLERSDRQRRSAAWNGALHAGRAAVGWTAIAALLAAPTPLMAQTTNPYANPYTPFGSPVDPYGQPQSNEAAPTQTTTPQPDPEPLRPVEIGSSRTGDSSDREDDDRGSSRASDRQSRGESVSAAEPTTKRPAPPNEFERYAEQVIGRRLPRFGADLLVSGSRDFAVAATASVPPSYVLSPGDQIFIGFSGSVDGSIDAEIDTNGRVFLPKIGSVRVGGVRYGDLQSVITRAASSQYRDFHVAVSVTGLRGIHVYVTGFANNPGAYTVSSLSTMVNALLAAGGPASGGSFRSAQLYRNGALVSDFDLYELVRHGDKSKDAVLHNEDVLFIPPLGPQVALTGSVNAEAIYETKPGETLDAILGYGGGATALADRSRVVLYRLGDRDTTGSRQLSAAQVSATPAEGGDIVRVLSEATLERPLEKRSVLVRIEGEVNRPGNYYVPANSSMADAMQLAGGLASRAFVFGTTFQRASVRAQQRQSFEEALQQVQISLAAAPLNADTSLDPATRAAQAASARELVDRLRQAQPDGRVVLDLTPSATTLPGQLVLEDNDRIYIPPRPTTVGVFGAVYRPASFFIGDAKPRSVRSYIDMAGGSLRSADSGEIFVVRANGAVISKRRGALNAAVLPGDVIFVPVKVARGSVWAKIAQVLSPLLQVGLLAATIAAVSN